MARRLAAILSADVVGYSRLMGADEAGTWARVKELRDELLDPMIAAHRGAVVKPTGDGVLAEFPSVVDAVECALDIQRKAVQRNAGAAPEARMELRIGINLGDIIFDQGDIYGDGVNLAVRLEGLAEPGGICVSRTVYNHVRNKLQVRFAPLGEQRLKNIAEPVEVYRVLVEGAGAAGPAARPVRARRRPLRWVAAVVIALLGVSGAAAWRFLGAPAPAVEEPAVSAADPLAIPRGPGVAVLPLDNLSADPAQDFFADGLTEEIITGLSRFRDLLVIARNSTYRYKDAPVDVREVGRELGVGYVLEGSVRKDGDLLRVTAQLLNATTGAHVWAETYDRDLTVGNILDVQDDITAKVVARIANPGGVISLIGLEHNRKTPTQNVAAYECVLLAYAYLLIYSPEAHLEARDCLERAVELDPDYADAWAWLAHMYDDEYANDLNPRPNSLARAREAARRAVGLDPMNQTAHWELAVNHFFQNQHDQFFIEAERAIDLNPNNAAAIGDLGIFMVGVGEWERGYGMARKAAALDPYGTVYYFPIFRYYYHKKDYKQALTAAQKIDLELPGKWYSIAAAAGQLGREEEARAAVAKLLELAPAFPDVAREKIWRIIHSEAFVEDVVDGLRKAGLMIP